MFNLQRVALILAFTCIALTACGGGNNHELGPPISHTTAIQSDPSFDGDIALTMPSTFTVTQGMSATVQSIFAGIDPVTGDEYRSFLDFQLTASTGIPGNAFIESAFLDIYVNSLRTNVGTLPIRIDLVEFQPPNIIATDYDRVAQPPLYSILAGPDFAQSDVGTNVSIDVTPLMVKAQEMGLADFQIRILEELGPPIPLLLEINDTTGADRGTLAPLLTVTYH